MPCASPTCAARSIDPHPGAADPPPDVADGEADASAGCNPDDVGEAEAAAVAAAADEAGAAEAAELTGLDAAGDEEEADEHAATPAPASTATAPNAAIRLVRLLELSIANPYLRGPGAAARTMSRNLAVYTSFKDDARLATVSERL